MQFYVIGKLKKLPRDAAIPCATLTPDGWNDFGYVTLFTLSYIRPKNVATELGHVKISSDVQHKRTKLDEEFQELPTNYFSLGQSLAYYKNIRKLKKTVREEILVGLRDVVFQPLLYEQYASLDVFTTSLMRYSEANMVVRDAGQFFSPTPPKGESKCSFLFTLKMREASSAHKLSVELGNEPLLPDRIMALIGKNGTGKTWLLGKLAAALSGDEVKGVGAFLPKRPAFQRVIAMSYSAFDRFNKPTTRRTFSYVYCGIYDANGSLLDRRRLLSKAKAAALKVSEQDRINTWSAMIESVLDETTMEAMSAYLFKDSTQVSTAPTLSSGQLVLVSTITELVASIELESMVLIDEPELHQHPNSVAGFLFSLSDLLRQFDSYAIIATHSPLVIQQIPARYVRLFIRTGTVTAIRELVRECFGENLTTITQEVFQTSASPSLYHEWFKRATADLTDKQLVALFPNGLSFNALSVMESVKQ